MKNNFKAPDGKDHIVTVRIPIEDHNDIAALAIMDECTFAEEVRMAMQGYVDKRRQDPALPEQVGAATVKIVTRLNNLLR